MSLYVEWLNDIKTKADPHWLTDSQKAAYDALVTKWPQHPVVCLCGPSGSGKSFIGRMLASHQGYVYTHDLSQVPAGSEKVVLDGAAYDRLLRTMAQMKGIKRLILLLRQAPKDPVPAATLALTQRDVRQFAHNLTHHKVLPCLKNDYDTADLGTILRHEAIARGDEYATQ